MNQTTKNHHNYKGDAAKDAAKRLRARGVYPTLGRCDNCANQATDRHHKDGNTGNNRKSNLALLCRKCHMIEDGRLARLAALPHPCRDPKPCRICKTLSKPMRRGKCHRCNEYFRRNNEEWKPNADRRFGHRAPDRYCLNCARLVVKGWSKGRCPACRLYLKRNRVERPLR